MIAPDVRYMRRALQIARGGILHASPNPMVGAVIVAPDGRIIGEGFHRRCGSPHAEPNAIASVSESDEYLLSESTMYVTLEPCSHYGRTPACARLIIEKHIPRVVIGSLDPFAKVNGNGARMLREAGVEVIVGMLEQECLELNRRFMTCHQLHRPWITLKWAMTSDGYIDARLNANKPAMKISSGLGLAAVHRLRAIHDAIIVGGGTVNADNPSLTVRNFAGDSPLRVVLGSNAVNKDADILQQADTLFFTSTSVDGIKATCIPVEPTNLKAVLTELFNRGISSVLVEGGAAVLQSFIDAGLWDVARVEVSPAPAPAGDYMVQAPAIAQLKFADS